MKTDSVIDSYLLSPMQQGMMFHSLSQPKGGGVDVEQIFCTLREELNFDAFRRAWERVVERHPILRTSFHWQNSGAPSQEVHRAVEIEFSTCDCRGLGAAAREKLFASRLEAERARGFDLSVAPLLRLAVFRHEGDEWRFLWTFHHLLVDGRTVVILLKEVFAFYEAFSRGGELDLPAPAAYRDFVDWLQNQDRTKAEAFWRQALAGITAPTPLVIARPRSETSNLVNIRGEQQVQLSKEATSRLASFARDNDLTLNTMVQGAWALLLSRYSGEEDVVFGAVRAGRRSTIERAETVVGLCINTVPLRVRVPAGARVLPWLADLRKNWRALWDFEQTPLVDILGWSDVAPGQPLFESIYNFQDPAWDAALRAQGGRWAARQFGICSQSNYPLVVDAYGGEELLVKILYHRTRFDDATITRMLGHFRMLLEGMTLPDAELRKIPMLTEEERRQLLVEWNGTAIEHRRDKCIHELFEEQAARAPKALAVADESTQLTYSELDRRASRLAAALAGHGIGPDICAGVCLERSVEMVVAFLAVLKAGGAYVPLDPGHPAERLAFMLGDAKIPVLITRQSICNRLKLEIPGLKILAMDALEGSESNSPVAPRAKVKPSNLAYVIYTSGSTGKPKGVAVERASLGNLIAWHQRVFQVTSADRATQVAMPVFDASVWELWPYLTAGASIHIPSEETRLSGEKLMAWLVAREITLTFIPTPIAEKMLELEWPSGSRLRAVLTGGDKLRRAPGKNFPCPLFNQYGPTENTVVATWGKVPPRNDGSVEAKPPPIGRPIDNTRIYILDDQLQPAPVGVPGQLHIGGASLARGYQNRPELTAEKFIPNPFAGNGCARLYKTGDLARWLPDGQLEFLGRMDNQVKIHGQRIELGEIESVLLQHPEAREAVAVICEPDHLAAYIVPAPANTLTPASLHDFLRHKLPGTMVPSAFVILEALPLTTNGKIDYRALPAPNFSAGLEKPSAAPATATEQKLAEIWSEILGVKQIGIHDNFFHLGGHSLMATRVISRIINAFQIELPFQELFTLPTLAELAARIDSLRQATPSAISSPAQLERSAESPLAFAQERVWFMEQLEPGLPVYNIPACIRLNGALNLEALNLAIAEIVRRHEPLRTVFKAAAGRPAAVVLPMMTIPISIVDLRLLASAEKTAAQRRWMEEQARESFDLATGPLMRAKLLRMAEDEHLLLLTVHHIIWDGWSLGVFYRELSALYAAYSNQQASPLPELQLNYGDCVRWQRERLEAGVLDEHVNFWKGRLSGAPPLLDLPTDRPRPPVQTYRGAMEFVTIPAELAGPLRQLSRSENVTLFMLLLAAFQTLLHRYTKQEDILVGSPIAGRTRTEAENMIGLFINTVVLRGDLSGDPAFRELLARTRTAALEAYAHQEAPFEKVVDAVQPGRDLSRPPLFQVMFILQNEPLRPLELTGLKLTPVPAPSATAKLDILLSLEETADGLGGLIEFNTDLFDRTTIQRLFANYQALLESIVANAGQRLSQLALLDALERRKVLLEWNDTRSEFAADKCVHDLFEEQAARTPDDVAVVFQEQQFTYRELNARANQLAVELQNLGVGREARVAICAKRSLDMMVGLLGILKAGGCYVPLDPAYPQERLAFILEDAQVEVLLTQEELKNSLGFAKPEIERINIDSARSASPNAVPRKNATSENLAYVIYTSGSTGKPKGVMVTHRNVANFFAGMDAKLGTEPGVWLAVTSISFDISVLELFWTLCRGYKVILHDDSENRGLESEPRAKASEKPMDFSLFYFANDEGNAGAGIYNLLISGAKFADEHGFAAVWNPERHFHAFGGIFPNPSVTAAAIAMVTQRVQIRAGSVVLPLHHPLRVAEEWSVVDNLSKGRVAVSFASGWHDRDFIFAPQNYQNRKDIMFDGIETVRKLWRGESIKCRTGGGGETEVKSFPRPVQKELPVWITAAGHPETFRKAGEMGANLLTHLLGQSLEDLEAKIRIYRAARAEHHNGEGRVALMLHTFVGSDLNHVLDTARGPFCDYLKSSSSLLKSLAHAGADGSGLNTVPDEDMDALAQRAFDRYSTTAGLLGTPESCVSLINKLKAIGVDEAACLIDFGVRHDQVIAGLPHLARLKELSNAPAAASNGGNSIPEEILSHRVTHMQCTPSLARTLLLSPESLQALGKLRQLLVGGEALPADLARQLRGAVQGEIFNMYGPTETTVWSAVHRIHPDGGTVTIGRPLANTRIYILDANLQPTPIGVPGEIFIGGEGVARGYLNRPELTAEKFIPDPPASTDGGRIYHTGDLGRFLADGTIEFLGRIDHQVKIRGHRIELGEIELALGLHPGVRQAVVVAREDSPGDKRLIAYILSSEKTPPTVSDLRRFTREKLPEAMTPSAFVFLESLPLTPNGKVNRLALPAPSERPELDGAFVAPSTPLENTIAAVWQEVLGLGGQPGLRDNFFDLGGNSLLVMQAQARLRQALGRDVPVVKLFQHPTIQALAGFLENTETNTLAKPQDRGRQMQNVLNRRRRIKQEVPA